jgi:hypothetical protein
LLRTIDTDATFLSARRIAGAVFTVLYDEPALLQTFRVVPRKSTRRSSAPDA